MDIRKLQRAIVDGLEDVKAQHIVVLNTEHMSPLFERVIIASGTSNRQTKALASSVRDSVKSRGMDVLRTEGEDNGEWIIVDCGAAVAHIMQPAIRDYYRLEEIWGGKPVRMKMDGAMPASTQRALGAAEAGRGAGGTGARRSGSASASSKKPSSPASSGTAAKPKAAPGRKPAAGAGAGTAARKTVAAKSPTARKTTARTTTTARKAPSSRSAAPAQSIQKVVVKAPASKSRAASAPAKRRSSTR